MLACLLETGVAEEGGNGSRNARVDAAVMVAVAAVVVVDAIVEAVVIAEAVVVMVIVVVVVMVIVTLKNSQETRDVKIPPNAPRNLKQQQSNAQSNRSQPIPTSLRPNHSDLLDSLSNKQTNKLDNTFPKPVPSFTISIY